MPVLKSIVTCQMPAACYRMERKFLQSFIKHVGAARMDWVLDTNSDGATFTGNVNAGFCHAVH